MTEPYRVAVVGLGIGKLHLASFRQLPDRYSIAAICDIDLDKARASAERHDACLVTADLVEVLTDPEIDVVDLCTPPALHVDQTLAALRAGKHVMCEKPLAPSIAAVDELAAAEATSGRRVMPIFQYRFGHGLQQAKKLVDDGIAGPGRTATVEVSWRRRAEYYSEAPWRGRWATELGGVLVTHAIHALDMLTYVAGPVVHVQARTATKVNDTEVEDCAAALLELADGTLATFSATLGSSAEITRHRFCFANLSAESNTEAYLNGFEPWAFTPDTPDVADDIERTLTAMERLPEHYVGQFHRFADALDHGADPPVTLADARAALEVVTAMYVSAREGREITLPLTIEDPAYRGWAP